MALGSFKINWDLGPQGIFGHGFFGPSYFAYTKMGFEANKNNIANSLSMTYYYSPIVERSYVKETILTVIWCSLAVRI